MRSGSLTFSSTILCAAVSFRRRSSGNCVTFAGIGRS
jgi:hypothetical protein